MLIKRPRQACGLWIPIERSGIPSWIVCVAIRSGIAEWSRNTRQMDREGARKIVPAKRAGIGRGGICFVDFAKRAGIRQASNLLHPVEVCETTDLGGFIEREALFGRGTGGDLDGAMN